MLGSNFIFQYILQSRFSHFSESSLLACDVLLLVRCILECDTHVHVNKPQCLIKTFRGPKYWILINYSIMTLITHVYLGPWVSKWFEDSATFTP